MFGLDNHCFRGAGLNSNVVFELNLEGFLEFWS